MKKDINKRKAFIIALVIYGTLAVIFFYVGLKYPDPPLEEGGVEIAMADWGFEDAGYGSAEPNEQIVTASAQDRPDDSNSDDLSEKPNEDMVTESTSEVSVPDPLANENQNESSDEPLAENAESDSAVVETQELNEALKNVLGLWDNAETSTSEGSVADASGNEGTATGKPEGIGTFGGNGSSYELGGRSMMAGPKVGEKPNEEGIVVLNIWVDRNGKVIRTAQNLRESNTTSQHLFNLAKNAALKAKFNTASDAPPEQRGKMTFIFILK